MSASKMRKERPAVPLAREAGAILAVHVTDMKDEI
jgi:hypothetical protein